MDQLWKHEFFLRRHHRNAMAKNVHLMVQMEGKSVNIVWFPRDTKKIVSHFIYFLKTILSLAKSFYIWHYCTSQKQVLCTFPLLGCTQEFRDFTAEPHSFSFVPIAQRMEYRKCMLQPHITKFTRLRGQVVKCKRTTYLRI